MDGWVWMDEVNGNGNGDGDTTIITSIVRLGLLISLIRIFVFCFFLFCSWFSSNAWCSNKMTNRLFMLISQHITITITALCSQFRFLIPVWSMESIIIFCAPIAFDPHEKFACHWAVDWVGKKIKVKSFGYFYWVNAWSAQAIQNKSSANQHRNFYYTKFSEKETNADKKKKKKKSSKMKLHEKMKWRKWKYFMANHSIC